MFSFPPLKEGTKGSMKRTLLPLVFPPFIVLLMMKKGLKIAFSQKLKNSSKTRMTDFYRFERAE
jgi:hypothetical protein